MKNCSKLSSRKNVFALKIPCDSSANVQLSKWLRYLADNWSLYTRHRARWTTISLPQQKMIKIILEIPQFSHAKKSFCRDKKAWKRKVRQKYEWNMLLHIRPLARHFSQYTRFTNMNKWKPEVPQSNLHRSWKTFSTSQKWLKKRK